MLVGFIIIASAVLGYLFINKKRNSDPLNRKSAAEICEYLVTTNPEDWSSRSLIAIFEKNARFRSQAKHIASMVPVLLIDSGVQREAALQTHPVVFYAAMAMPK